MEKYILVTGGAGYIGSHACKALKAAGYTPVTFDNLSTGHAAAVQFGPLVEGDLLHPDVLERVFTEYDIAGVMHFAAFSQVGESVEQPGVYWRNNVVGSMNLLDAMVRHGVQAIVFSSTCATYGEHDGVTLNEDTPQLPTNPYGASKRAIEDMIAGYEAAGKISSVTFRYFNVAGADPDATVGEWHIPETHLIPLILDAAAGIRGHITVFGDDYDTADGTCVRDYIHVADLVDAHVLGLERLLAGNAGGVYNLGTGTGFSVQEVIDVVQQVTEKAVVVERGERRVGDCARLLSGSTKAIEELGWQPTRSDLSTMVADAWRWHQTGGYSKN